MYYEIFDSHIDYANVIWAQNFNVVNRVSILEKKATRTISLLARDYHSSPPFKKQNLLKACVHYFLSNFHFHQMVALQKL